MKVIAFSNNDAKLLAGLCAMSPKEVNNLVVEAINRGYAGDDLSILVDVMNQVWPDIDISIYCEEDENQKRSDAVAMLEGLCDKALAEGVIAQVESEYIVGVVRSSCSKIREITVSAANESDAKSKALEGAGDYTYSEGDADYLVETVRKV